MSFFRFFSFFVVGNECKWSSTAATLDPDEYDTFDDYRATLTRSCSSDDDGDGDDDDDDDDDDDGGGGEPYRLVVTPTADWPDELYYQVVLLC